MGKPADPNPYGGSRRRLQALIEASMALGETRDLQLLLRRILDLATTHVGADRGALFTRAAGSGQLTATIFHGDEVEQISLRSGQGIVGEVAATGACVRLTDAYEDERFDRSVDQRTGYRTRSLIAVPLLLRTGDVVGVIELLNKTDGEFDDDDEDFLQAFGAQAAVALETARLTEERIRGERLEAIGTVSANLVHDLKNPLSGIHGYADLILQRPPADLVERCVRGIRRQTQRMNHMVTDILRFVRGEQTLLVSKIDFDVVLDEIVEDLRAAHGSDGVQIKRGGSRVGTVRADAMALRRLVDNLSRNAVEAMAGSGEIQLEASLDQDDVLLLFSDKGPGMDPTRIEALFGAFETEGKHEGTGLGLAIVRQIVEGHGGTIDVESAPDAGTTFRMRFPVKGPPAEDAPPG